MKEDMEGLTLHGIYQHYKNPEHLYKVLGTVLNSKTREVMVMYRQLYDGESSRGTKWVESKKIFLENIVVNRNLVPRFKFIGTKMPFSKEERKNRINSSR